jgi:mitochondrial fission protein ELM1
VARYIRQQSGGRAKLVHVGNPREELDDFDLQITTPQYSRGPAPNLLELPFPIDNPARATRASFEELAWLRELARPLRLIAVGGPARHWALDHKTLRKALETLRSKHPSGGIVIATSPRTGSSTRKFLANTADAGEPIIERFPRFPVLLAEADEIYVTADSVSMISEAVLTGKPVGIVPIKRSHSGRAADLLYERPTGKAAFPDFRNFWAMLERRELVGTVELPVASQVCDTVERAADAVRSLFGPGDWVDEGKPSCTASDLGASRRARGR